jgi:predicted phosphodiesterase
MSGLGDAIDEAVAEEQGVDPRLRKLEGLAKELHQEGIDFRVDRGEVYVGRNADSYNAEIDLPPSKKQRLLIGVVSDTHLGSSYEQLTALKDFYQQCEEAQVDFFIHAGDLVQGTPKMHRGMEHEVHLHSVDGQIEYAAEVYPKASVPTYMITGNHDDSWTNESGINVVRRMAMLRDDIRYIGRDACYFSVGGLRMYVVHPDGGSSYAKSYKAQKLMEALPEREGVQLAIIGHYHTYGVFKIQNTVCVMQPCFQGQYPWLVRKGLYPTIGGQILELEYDDTTITRFSHTLIEYDERSQDWDRDISFKHARPSAA